MKTTSYIYPSDHHGRDGFELGGAMGIRSYLEARDVDLQQQSRLARGATSVRDPGRSGVAWVGPDLVLMSGKGEEADPIAAGRFKLPSSTWQRIAGRFIRHRTAQAGCG